MSSLAPILPRPTPLPRHLYGTRAALFHILRETVDPADAPRASASAASAPVTAASASVTAAPAPVAALTPSVVRMMPPAPQRPSLGALLHSDSFDFRGGGDPV